MKTIILNASVFSEINNLIEVLIWPLLLIIFILLFRKKISKLIESLKRIKFSELEAVFDEREKKFAEEDITPLNDELDDLRKRIAILEKEHYKLSSSENFKDKTTDKSAIDDKLRDALENSPYKWRSIPKLSSISGITEDDVLKILRNDTNVILSRGKSGRRIARMKNN